MKWNSILAFIGIVLIPLFALTQPNNDTELPRRGYVGKRFPQNGTDASSQYIQHQNTGLPLQGFIVDNAGNKIPAVIAYQEPEKLLANEFNLAICKEANGKKVDILNPDSEPNFGSWLDKETIRAFYVGDQLFAKRGSGKWYIVITEGAISELATLTKVTSNGVSSYQVTEYLQKLNQEPVGLAGMTLNFKNTMSSMVFENTEMATKIASKTTGYKWIDLAKIISEYNAWHFKNVPGQVDYIMPYEYAIPAATTDDYGQLLFRALAQKSTDILTGIIAFDSSILKTLEASTTNEQTLHETKAELKSNFNEIVYRKSLEVFKQIVYEDWADLDMSRIKFDKFIFTPDEQRTNLFGFDYGYGELYLWVYDNPYQVNVGKLVHTLDGWKGFDFKIIPMDIQPATNTTAVQETPVPARYDLSPEFSHLPGFWTFYKAEQLGKDVSAEFKEFYLDGKPMTLEFKASGDVVYPQGSSITGGYWEYLPEQEKNFRFERRMNDGSSVKSFRLIAVTETEMRYEDPKMKVVFIFRR
jgi:hypothetical protein